MAKTTTTGFVNDTQFFLDYLIEPSEYTTLKDSVTNKLLEEVEIKGFRKGKAPREKALENISAATLGQKILEKVVNDHSPAAVTETTKELKKHDRMLAGLELDYDPKNTSETEEGGFKMRVLANLMPAIDLSKVETLKIEEPTQKDITDLPEFEVFKEQEFTKLMSEQNSYDPSPEGTEVKKGLLAVTDMTGKVDGLEVEGLHSHAMQVMVGGGNFLPEFEENLIGLKKGDTKEFDLPFPANYATELAGKTAQVKVTVTDVLTPKYDSLDDLLSGNEQLKKFYKDKDALSADIKNVYSARVDQVIDNIKRKRIVESVLKLVPDFTLDEVLIETEVTRIFSTLLQEAATKNISIGQALAAAGISTKVTEKLTDLDKDAVKEEISHYVHNEVKLTNILSTIYQSRVDTKPTPEEFEATIKDAMADKKKYNVDESFDEARVRNVINDRIIRQAAGNYLLELSKKNQTK